MSTERVTVSLPAEVRQAVQEAAHAAGLPLSAVVSEAITTWLRGRLVDSWLIDFQDENGAFEEDELRALAADAGVPYIEPPRRFSAA